MVKTESEFKVITGIAPVADAFSGTVYSDVINASNAQWITALVYWGVGTTGTITITAIPCDDTTPSNRGTAVPFTYRRYNNSDVPGATTAATASGFTTTAGSNQVYAIEIDPASLGASGYRYVQIKCVESVNDPLLGGIMILTQPSYPSGIVATMLS